MQNPMHIAAFLPIFAPADPPLSCRCGQEKTGADGCLIK